MIRKVFPSLWLTLAEVIPLPQDRKMATTAANLTGPSDAATCRTFAVLVSNGEVSTDGETTVAREQFHHVENDTVRDESRGYQNDQ